MARRAAIALLLVGLLSILVSSQDDFDLSDAIVEDNKKLTTPPPKNPSADDGFNLEDAVGGGENDPMPHNPPKPRPDPNPRQPGSGGFSDSDLAEGASDGGGGHGGSGGRGGQAPDGEGQGEAPGVVPGIVGAVVVAVAGAISSFIAYQKKKLCFKENTDQGEVNMENHHSTNAEPPVQRTLLEK